MTPTREQVIEWAKEAGLSFDDGWVLYTPKRPSLPEPEIDAFIAAMNAAHAAGRDQGLREAAQICRTTPPEPFRPSIEAAHAIEQLRGK